MNELKECLDRRLDAVQWTEGDTKNVLFRIQKPTGEKTKKSVSAVIAAALALAILATMTVLAESQWGLVHWLFRYTAHPDVPLETVTPMVTGDASLDTAALLPVEAVTDGYGLYLSVLCTPEEENTLLLNASLDPNRDPVSEIGIASAPEGQTIAAWAKARGMTSIRSIHVFSDGYSADTSKLETFDSGVSAAMRLLEDGSSLIMLAGSFLDGRSTYELSYTVIPYTVTGTGRSADPVWTLSERSDDRVTGKIRFTVPETGATTIQTLASYRPALDTGEEGPIRIERAELLQSPLASYFSVVYTLGSGARQEEMLPIFGPVMEEDGAFSWPELYMHGRKANQRSDGGTEYVYFCTRIISDVPNELEVGGGFMENGDMKAIPPVRLIRQDP